MKLVGNCHLCGKPAMQTCSSCGLVTCRACIDSKTGICQGCSPGAFDREYEDDEDEY